MVPMDALRRDLAHLFRRAGFGASPAQLDAAQAAGFEATVDHLLELSGPDPGAEAVAVPELTGLVVLPRIAAAAPARAALSAQLRREDQALVAWWLKRMVGTERPLREKLALIWHGHFATSVAKVRFPKLMYDQNLIFQTMGWGSFADLVQAVAKDPAMLIWLDAGTDKKAHPNENFARELLERFTMGLGTYTEQDVRQAARCFTGWVLDRATGAFALQAQDHDYGTKVFLGRSGDFGGEDVIDIAVHTPASARFVCAKLWSHLAYPVATTDPVVSELAPGYAADLDLSRLVRAILLHPQFRSDQARAGLVKQPVEYVAGALKALGLDASAPFVLGALAGLGQVPFAPPDVGGWPQNLYWLSSASALARLRFAEEAARRADLSAVADQAPSARLDALADLLGVQWSAATASALRPLAHDPPRLVALALVSPEYVSN
jgi:uncharacterized protein (DUF1800 family)